jgi:prophage antirepressor-like protein
MNNTNEIVLYQPDTSVHLEVVLDNETVWLTQTQIAELFGVKVPAISKHLKNIFESGELIEKSVVSKMETTAADGKRYKTNNYNLDVIISVGYRINSINATKFRQWATTVLRDYLLHGYAIHDRFERIEHRMEGIEETVDFFVKTALPPIEGVFYGGQIFDAYEFFSKLVKSAKNRIVLIDNYVDESVLVLLSKRKKAVSAIIYTTKITKALQLDVNKHNEQYPPIAIKRISGVHDRFLIIDENVYHIGASIKDLGKKLFGFSKMEISAKTVLNGITVVIEQNVEK